MVALHKAQGVDSSKGNSYFFTPVYYSIAAIGDWITGPNETIKENSDMQRHKSVEKRVRSSKRANLTNRQGRSRITTATKKVLETSDPATAQEALRNAISVIDKSVKSGLIHKNKAANRKSKLSRAVNKLAVK